jgi:hypothetical protein
MESLISLTEAGQRPAQKLEKMFVTVSRTLTPGFLLRVAEVAGVG